jgi:hypothetical protein
VLRVRARSPWCEHAELVECLEAGLMQRRRRNQADGETIFGA